MRFTGIQDAVIIIPVRASDPALHVPATAAVATEIATTHEASPRCPAGQSEGVPFQRVARRTTGAAYPKPPEQRKFQRPAAVCAGALARDAPPQPHPLLRVSETQQRLRKLNFMSDNLTIMSFVTRTLNTRQGQGVSEPLCRRPSGGMREVPDTGRRVTVAVVSPASATYIE